MAITLAELVYSELIGLVQRTRVSYPACFNKIRLTENMVDKRESYTKEDLLASGRGELFGAKGPQLPAPSMLIMDRVIKMTETGGNFDKGYVEAELDINPDLWFFGCHFIGDPVMPGCLGLDAMWQLVGFFLGWMGGQGRGRALGCGEVKFTGQVRPEAKKLRYHIHMKRVILRKLVMGIADANLEVDGRTIYTGKDLRVGLFTSTDGF